MTSLFKYPPLSAGTLAVTSLSSGKISQADTYDLTTTSTPTFGGVRINGSQIASFDPGIGWWINSSYGLVMSSNQALIFCAGDAQASSLDTFLLRDSANTLALRNDTNPQEFRTYGTYSSSGANREYMFMKALSAGNFQLGLSAVGSGVNRDLEIVAHGEKKIIVENAGVRYPDNYGFGASFVKGGGGSVALRMVNTAGVEAIRLETGSWDSFITDKLGIGTKTPTEKLTVAGNISAVGQYTAYKEVSANYTLSGTESTINCVSAANYTIQLHTSIGYTGRIYNIKNTNTGTITVSAYQTETIDGGNTLQLTKQYESITLQSTGTGWIIL